MAAPNIDAAKPAKGNAFDTDLDQIRDNWAWFIAICLHMSLDIPGWNATPAGADLDKPDYVDAVHTDGRKVRVAYSYTGDNQTSVVVQYDKGLGAGYETLTKGTGTRAFNASDQWTGTTWA